MKKASSLANGRKHIQTVASAVQIRNSSPTIELSFHCVTPSLSRKAFGVKSRAFFFLFAKNT
jgi:hypothetical protein